MTQNNDYPLVTFMIKGSQYAISAQFVSNMVAVPPVRPVPHAPPYVRGLINLRGKVLPLVDLRVRLGYRSSLADLNDFIHMLEQREQDHRNWVTELEKSVLENREFELTSDPHQCAFGQWYDNYESDDLSAMAILRKFDRPHKRIHRLAHKVESLMANGDHEGAQELIQKSRDKELSLMIQLFNNITQLLKETTREIAMIVETHRFHYAIAIDMVRAVEFLAPGTTEKLPVGIDSQLTNNLVTLIGRRQSDNSSVQILDSMRICDPDDVKGLEIQNDQEQQEKLQPA